MATFHDLDKPPANQPTKQIDNQFDNIIIENQVSNNSTIHGLREKWNGKAPVDDDDVNDNKMYSIIWRIKGNYFIPIYQIAIIGNNNIYNYIVGDSDYIVDC